MASEAAASSVSASVQSMLQSFEMVYLDRGKHSVIRVRISLTQMQMFRSAILVFPIGALSLGEVVDGDASASVGTDAGGGVDLSAGTVAGCVGCDELVYLMCMYRPREVIGTVGSNAYRSIARRGWYPNSNKSCRY